MSQRYYVVVDANDHPMGSDGVRTCEGAFAYESQVDAFTAAKLFTSKTGNSHAIFEIKARMVCQKTVEVQVFRA